MGMEGTDGTVGGRAGGWRGACHPHGSKAAPSRVYLSVCMCAYHLPHVSLASRYIVHAVVGAEDVGPWIELSGVAEAARCSRPATSSGAQHQSRAVPAGGGHSQRGNRFSMWLRELRAHRPGKELATFRRLPTDAGAIRYCAACFGNPGPASMAAITPVARLHPVAKCVPKLSVFSAFACFVSCATFGAHIATWLRLVPLTSRQTCTASSCSVPASCGNRTAWRGISGGARRTRHAIASIAQSASPGRQTGGTDGAELGAGRPMLIGQRPGRQGGRARSWWGHPCTGIRAIAAGALR